MATLYVADGQGRGDRRGAGRTGTPNRVDRRARARRRARAGRPRRRACASRASNTRPRWNRKCAPAVAGGVTSLACPPDTDPPLDEPGLVEMLKHRARSLNLAHVLSARRADRAARRARTLTEMAELAEAGCVAFSQADVPLVDTQVLLRAMQYAATFGYRVWLRPQDAASRAGRRRARRRGGDAPRPRRRFRRSPRRSRWPRSSRSCATPARACTCAGCRRADGVAMVRAAKRDGPAGDLRRRDPSPAPVRRRHRLVRRAVPPRAAAAQHARPRRAPRRARRRHDRRRLLGPHAGRRRREAAAVRRGRAGRDRARAAAAADAQVGGGEQVALPAALARITREPARDARHRRRASRAPGQRGRCLHLRSASDLDGRAGARCEPGQEHAVPRARGRRARSLHAGRQARWCYEG